MRPLGKLSTEAKRYARGGWAVFPLVPGHKQPMTPNGFHDATTDDDVIDAWWKAEPTANIGLVPPPGVVVLDFDPRNGCPSPAELGLSPNTLSVYTASGGAHFYYRVPSEWTARAHWPDVDGVDVKQAHNGYVVLPPSVVNGRAYEWTGTGVMRSLPPHALETLASRSRDITPAEVSGAKFWPWEAGTPYGLVAVNDQVSKVEDAAPGTRNHTLYKATLVLSKLIAGGEVSDACLSLVREAALASGLHDHEVYATMLSAYERGSKEPMEAPSR